MGSFGVTGPVHGRAMGRYVALDATALRSSAGRCPQRTADPDGEWGFACYELRRETEAEAYYERVGYVGLREEVERWLAGSDDVAFVDLDGLTLNEDSEKGEDVMPNDQVEQVEQAEREPRAVPAFVSLSTRVVMAVLLVCALSVIVSVCVAVVAWALRVAGVGL